MRQWYSRRHYERLANAGSGNPQLTNSEKCKVWRGMIVQYPGPGHEAVRAALESLIREHGENP